MNKRQEEFEAHKKAALERALIKYADRIAKIRETEGQHATLPLTFMGEEYEWMSRAERRAKKIRR